MNGSAGTKRTDAAGDRDARFCIRFYGSSTTWVRHFDYRSFLALLCEQCYGLTVGSGASTVIKRGDFILAACLGAAGIAGGAWYAVSGLINPAERGDSPVVVCQSKSGFYRADPLSSDVEYEVETPGTGYGRDADGGTNLVKIQDGSVWVAHANCKNQDCVEHKPIQKDGEQIVCLPHGVTIQIAAREEDVARLQ